MDKRSASGLALITVIVIAWLYYQSTTYKPPQPPPKQKDTTGQASAIPPDTTKAVEQVKPEIQDSATTLDKFGLFGKFSTGTEEIITIETDLFTAEISNRGVSIRSWELKKYKKWDKKPSQLIWGQKGQLFQKFKH